MWGYVLWAGRGDVPPSAPRDDRTRESGTKESFALETTVLPRPYLALRRGRPGLWSRLSKAQIPGTQAGRDSLRRFSVPMPLTPIPVLIAIAVGVTLYQQVFTTGTVVQVFLLASGIPAVTWNSSGIVKSS